MANDNTLQQLERTADEGTDHDSLDMKLRAMEIHARVRAKLRELDRAAGFPVAPLN
jgi:hypothetical protein